MPGAPIAERDGLTSMTNTMTGTKKTPRKTLPARIGKVLKRLHYPLEVILLRGAQVCGVFVEPAQPRR